MINAKRVWKWRVGHLIALVVIVLFGYLVYVFYEDVAVKMAWGTLNDVASRHLGDSETRAPILVKRDARTKHVLLGIPSGDSASPFEWIVLDAAPRGLVIKNPVDGHFKLTCPYLARLRLNTSVDPAVYEFLAAQCSS